MKLIKEKEEIYNDAAKLYNDELKAEYRFLVRRAEKEHHGSKASKLRQEYTNLCGEILPTPLPEEEDPKSLWDGSPSVEAGTSLVGASEADLEKSDVVLQIRMDQSGSAGPTLPLDSPMVRSDDATDATEDLHRDNRVLPDGDAQKVEQYLTRYDDSELESVESYAPSILSKSESTSSWSSSTSPLTTEKMPPGVLEGVEHILAEPFLSHTTFGPAYVAAIENIGVHRFSRNLTRLLNRYASELRKEAQGWLEANTARAVRAVQFLLS